jgi:hypothetical protein
MTETVEIRAKTRRVKDHILNRFLTLADKVDTEKPLDHAEKELYRELMFTFARNVIPRSQEIGGDPENTTPVPILMTTNVSTDNGNQEDSPTPKADSGSTGRDLSE